MASAGFCSVNPQPNISKPNPNRSKLKPSSSANWWAPLFGWSSDPDYIQISTGVTSSKKIESGQEKKDSGMDRGSSRSTRFVLGSFTDEKAKELRKMTRETSTFHDVMYHSAIASRLASDVTGRKDG